jgi:hypothetical protein
VATGRGIVGAVAGFAIVLVAGARDADAYVRYQGSSGNAFAWMPSCLPLPIAVYPGTFSQMSPGEVAGAATAATAAWSAGANPCTFIDFTVSLESGSPRRGNDGRNAIILRNTSWCQLDATGACNPAGPIYDPASLALTTVTARASTGEIFDADIEINAFQFPWADRIAHPELADRHDLQNVLTHEFGHVLGLDHSCFVAGVPPMDHTGQPVPECANASASVSATTMYPSSTLGDLERRTLEPDDRAGVCGIYPAAATPCPPGTDASCVCPPPGADGGLDAGDGGGPDASPADAGGSPDAPPADAGKTSSGGGCGCDVGAGAPRRFGPTFPFLAGVAAAMTALGRRRRR